MKDPRYDGKPFLRLVELYVQHIIGALSEHDASRLTQMTPKLKKTFGREGDWHAIIASEMEFDGALDSNLKLEWERARAAGLTAENFSRLAADKLIAP